ncbi:TRAP transporter, 4TM/12TM fusion protein, unknown substrate 2 [Geomicrobium sp. JCM 19055]|nr:TRAP transporter, 4TM/12TM fusion protein, unknown substrate 2 [Geomicrobium sp. JCM 19055]
MASFIGVAYLEIALAAIIPAILFFLAVFLQVDAYAAKRDLKGIHKSKLPKLFATLTNGWMYLLSILALILVLIFIRSEAQAPFYASALVLVLSFFSTQAKLTWQSFKTMIFDIGKVLGEIVSLIAGIGLIVGAFSATGVSFSFSRELVQMAGDNLLLLLIAGAVTSFILGMGMTVSASYIFLAIVLAPALAQVGVNVIAAHLFVLYWATASYITPPVALASFAASSIANSNPLRTSVVSTKLGIVTFFIPFFIVYQPALIWQGTFTESIVSILAAVVGVFLISASLSGYLVGVGRVNVVMRGVLLAGGLLMLMPSIVVNLTTIAVMILLLIIYKVIKKQRFNQSGTVDVSNS